MKRLKIFLTLLMLLFTVLSPAKVKGPGSIIPVPSSFTEGKGSFNIRGAAFNCSSGIPEAALKEINRLADDLYVSCGKMSSVSTAGVPGGSLDISGMKGVFFIMDKALADEEYGIDVTSRSVLVRASSFNGFLYAIQSIRQMLPEELYAAKPALEADWKLPVCSIKDKPRFGYRGMLLDCARHFFSVEEIKRFMDIMAVYKLNVFHWHFTDDQGWRIEIKSRPRLCEVGAFRSGTMIGIDFKSSDGVRYGGYYTREQIREVVSYAASRGITVIPEIDLPGHMVAALASYPELGCTGGPYEVRTIWGVANEVLCPGKEETFRFLEDVLGEVAELFPSEYIHIGGDECPKTEWKKCPDCQARIAALGLADGDGATKEERLQNYVTSRIQAFLSSKGKKIIGWDEILEGELSPGATVMSWRGSKGGIAAAKKGFDVIMTPNTHLYFCYRQSNDLEREPFGIHADRASKVVSLEKVYSFDPVEGLDPSTEAPHIIGVQASLWTEYISRPFTLYYMLLPRLAAVSELQWSPSATRDYGRFTSSLEGSHYKIYDTLGYNYRDNRK